MTDSRLALVIGLFVIPTVLLWLGHRMRRQTEVRRRVFWGATIGYVLGMLLTLVVIHYPAVLWTGGGWRTAMVHWGMLVGAAVGAAIGAITAKRGASPAGRPHRS
jgi:L-cystine uptake protein TcyP (sodium:dicarboxylate symporter family)